MPATCIRDRELARTALRRSGPVSFPESSPRRVTALDHPLEKKTDISQAGKRGTKTNCAPPRPVETCACSAIFTRLGASHARTIGRPSAARRQCTDRDGAARAASHQRQRLADRSQTSRKQPQARGGTQRSSSLRSVPPIAIHCMDLAEEPRPLLPNSANCSYQRLRVNGSSDSSILGLS